LAVLVTGVYVGAQVDREPDRLQNLLVIRRVGDLGMSDLAPFCRIITTTVSSNSGRGHQRGNSFLGF